MATESIQRRARWITDGCNSFNAANPSSKPLSFWTEQDILSYLITYNIPYCPVYGEIKKTNDGFETTGCSRTGCMFCMYGCHHDATPNRFQRMKETHPKQYAYCMKPWEDGGLGLKSVLDFINVPAE